MTNQLKTATLLAALSGLLIAISYWIIGGSSGLIIGIGLAAVTNLFSWYQSDKIALAVYRAQPVSEREAPGLYRMVQRLSDRANISISGQFLGNLFSSHPATEVRVAALLKLEQQLSTKAY